MQPLTDGSCDPQRISNRSLVRVCPLIEVMVTWELELRVRLLLSHPWVVIKMETLVVARVDIWNALFLEYHVLGPVYPALSSISITSTILSLLLHIVVLPPLIRGLALNLLLLVWIVLICIYESANYNIKLLFVTVRVDFVLILVFS